MTRIAFLTDVHGNLPALEAVLADTHREGAEEIWDGGDAVGYHPWPGDCARLLADRCTVTIMGNYDRKVLKAPRRRQRWLRRKNPLKAHTLIWAYEQMDAAAREVLEQRTSPLHREVEGRRVLICHGSPTSRKEPLGPATRPTRWRELADFADADLVLSGHTHRCFSHREGRVLFVNPGAVGRSEDGDPRAAYALLDFRPGNVDVSLRRVEYDQAAVADEIRRRQLPPVFAAMVLEGISLPRAARLHPNDRI